MSKPARPAGPNPLQGKDLRWFFRRYSITPQSARCGPFLGCARDSIRPTLLPLAGASRIPAFNSPLDYSPHWNCARAKGLFGWLSWFD